MYKRLLAGSVVGSIVAFLLGWVIFGMLLHPVYESGIVYYEGLMKESPNLLPLFFGNLAFATLLAIFFDNMHVATVRSGAIWGAIIFALIMFAMDSFLFATMNLYKPMTLVVDVIANTAFGAIMGAVIAFVMSKVS
jgi:hypothetical protein